jgi:hypothetical protein
MIDSDKYQIEVKLLAITGLLSGMRLTPQAVKNPDCEELIEYSGRLCWDTTEKLGINPNRIQEWINIGHESVIEQRISHILHQSEPRTYARACSS